MNLNVNLGTRFPVPRVMVRPLRDQEFQSGMGRDFPKPGIFWDRICTYDFHPGICWYILACKSIKAIEIIVLFDIKKIPGFYFPKFRDQDLRSILGSRDPAGEALLVGRSSEKPDISSHFLLFF